MANLVEITPQNRIQAGVKKCGIAPRNQANQWRNFCRSADFVKSDFARDDLCLPFVRIVGVSIHQADGDRFNVLFTHLQQRFSQLSSGFNGKRCQDLSVGRDSFIQFDDMAEQGQRFDDISREQIRTRLIADQGSIREAFGGDQQCSCAGTSQQGIGSASGAETDLHGRARLM